MASEYWLGVDLGGTKILAAVFDGRFKIVGRDKENTPFDQGPKAVFDAIGRAVDRTLAAAGVSPQKIRGMGLGVPGQMNPNTLFVKYCPNLNWHDVDLHP